MIDDMISLREKFNQIRDIGWVESMRKGTTGIGYTFEKLIGKNEDSLPLPDFGTIEIKTRFMSSKYPISLFNATPDGDYPLPMKRLYEKYGFLGNQHSNNKVFYATMYGNRNMPAGNKYLFRLKVDFLKEEIRVFAIDLFGNVEDTKISWSFNFIKEKVEKKIKYLALVKAYAHNEIEKQFFKYCEINFYFSKGFKRFISLVDNGTIGITFMIGTYKTGIKSGQMNNHGASFQISEDDLEKLFTKV